MYNPQHNHKTPLFYEDCPRCVLNKAASDLLAACEEQHKAIDSLFAMLITIDTSFFPSKCGQPWQACLQGNAAIRKAHLPGTVPHYQLGQPVVWVKPKTPVGDCGCKTCEHWRNSAKTPEST